MSAFYIWDPSVVSVDRKRIRFVLTNGDVTSGAFDEHEFVATVFQELDVDAAIKQVAIKPLRSRYYSEYLEEDDWRSIWPVVWSYDVELKKPVDWRVRLKDPLGTNATGSGELVPGPKDKAPIACLVCSNFASASKASKAIAKIAVDVACKGFREEYELENPAVQQLDFGKGLQLQLDLGTLPSQFFVAGADYAMRVQAICEEHQGVVHYQG